MVGLTLATVNRHSFDTLQQEVLLNVYVWTSR
jgi:hypothetical protein